MAHQPLTTHPGGKQQARGRATGNSLKWLVSHMAAGHLRPRGSCPASPPSLPGLEPVPHHCAYTVWQACGCIAARRPPRCPDQGARCSAATARWLRRMAHARSAVAREIAREIAAVSEVAIEGRRGGRQGRGEPSGRGWGVAWVAAMGLVPRAKLASMGGLSSADRVEGKGRPQGAARSLAASAPCAAVTVVWRKKCKNYVRDT